MGLSALITPVLAQIDQGSITGTVKDPSGATVPGATVVLENSGTGFKTTAQTDSGGVYTFSPVKVGRYSLTVSTPGFVTTERSGVELQVAQRLTVDFNLTVGQVNETVNVSAQDVSLLQTEDTSTGQVISSRELDETPLNGRNYVYIAQLAAGVQEGNNYYTGSKGGFVANGTRGEQTNFVLDGVDNNSGSPDLLNGANYVVKPPPDALQEFKVQTSNASAEFGHSAGAIINATIRSGTNDVHGRLWEYFRNDALDAKDLFAASKPEYRQNQFGGMLGGPIVKNKLFFFGDYESNRIIYGTPQTVTVPTLKMRAGDFSELLSADLTGGSQKTLYVPGSAGTQSLQCNGVQNVYCPGQLAAPGSQLAMKLLNMLPAPNLGAPGQTYSNYQGVVKDSDITNQFDIRGDWNISQKDLAFVRFSWGEEPRYLPSIFGTLGSQDFTTGDEKNDSKNFVLSETHLFTPTLTNEFRFGYNWLHIQRTQFNPTVDQSAALGLGGVPFGNIPDNGGTPAFNVSGVSAFGSSTYQPSVEYANTYQILDNLTKVLGNQTLKTGISIISYRTSLLQPPQSRGTYNYSGYYTSDPNNPGSTGFGVADFLADFQDNAALSNPSNIEDDRWAYAGYIQDDWKINGRLTVNLGLRYEFTGAPYERHDHQANFITNAPRTAATLLLPDSQKNTPIPPGILNNVLVPDAVAIHYTGDRTLVGSDPTNFGPRVGVSYRVANRAVVRAAYGIFYGGYEPIGGYYNLGFNAPFAFDATFNRPGCAPPPGTCNSDGIGLQTGFQNALDVGLSNYVSTTTLRGAPSFNTVVNQQWNAAVQYAISKSTTASVTYVGNHGSNAPTIIDSNEIGHLLTVAESQINNPLGINFYRPFPDVGFAPAVVYAGYSNYNAMNASVERRFTDGLMFVANYTLSHASEMGQSPLGDILNGAQGIRNPFQLGYAYDYGESSMDVPQRFTFNGQYELPFGKGRKYLNTGTLANLIVGGWATSLVFRTQSGNVSPVFSTNNPTNGVSGATAYQIADPFKPGGTPDPTIGQDPSVCSQPTRTINHWFNPCAFRNPLPANSDSDLQAYGPRGTS
ncbi:MAG: TonB-dependent receptor, partial [Deltaproteobacteria bacterium]|nr:TonB-dependent receptor [Deltaproteobacteria bacterium]